MMVWEPILNKDYTFLKDLDIMFHSEPAHETCHCLNFKLCIKLDDILNMCIMGKGQMCWGRAESIVTGKEAHNAHTLPLPLSLFSSERKISAALKSLTSLTLRSRD
jgi:hypothetical protein